MARSLPKFTRLDKPVQPDTFGIANSAIGFFLMLWQDDMLVRLHLLPAHSEDKPELFLQDFKLSERRIAVMIRDDKRAAALVSTHLFPQHRWTGVFTPDLHIGYYGTAFRFRAMKAMLDVPAGKTVTYARLAQQAESDNAFRAAGSACANNPLPFIVPCHRILASNGGLGGYGYGTALKSQLLDWEQNT